ncbi:fumarylacetoacetate hydrolase family protein [soil metagenome]
MRDITDLTRTLLATKGVNQPLPSADPDFDLDSSYKVAHGLRAAQSKQGKKLVGRKIGISNRAAWGKMGLSDVVWGYVFDDMVFEAEDNRYTLSLDGLHAPKLEPEIVFGLNSELSTGTRDPVELLQAVEWLALGFEVVQNPYPDWQFKPADLFATFWFHGALVLGSKVRLEGMSLSRLAGTLAETVATLYKDDVVVAEGSGANVVDSPAVALGHIADLIANDSEAAPLQAVEFITTCTLTDAPAVAAGETYRVEVTGLDLPPLTLSFS